MGFITNDRACMLAALGQGGLLGCDLVSMDTAQTEVTFASSFERLAVACRHSSKTVQRDMILNSCGMHVRSIGPRWPAGL
jgi:trehalose-6-phosphate synthase